MLFFHELAKTGRYASDLPLGVEEALAKLESLLASRRTAKGGVA
jgi:hypothetical protein